MSHRKVREVMTASMVTVGVDTPFKELAVLMAGRGVSALPVLDAEGNLAGMVSEADLLPKQEAQEDPRAGPLRWWRRWLARDRAAGTSAADVMTSLALTIGLDDSVVAAARLMERHRIKRLAVTSPDGRLAGIVSRADLVRVFCRPDPEIREEIVREVFTDFLGTNPALVRVTVTEGVVTLAGEVEKKSMIPLALRMARSVDGVVDVTSELTFAVDDTRLPPVRDLTNY
jgi:CBS-domain-containing membrane protein